jgi:hypothetical protein
MLVCTGGRQSSEPEFETPYAGFKLTRGCADAADPDASDRGRTGVENPREIKGSSDQAR